MHSILSHFNFQLTYADDGLHGLHATKSGSPDLIICAVNIPILNGLDMCRMIRNDKGIRNIPIIFLHDELNLSYIKAAKNIDVSAFLIKPYLDNSLIYAIKRALRQDNLHVNKDRKPVAYEDCKVPLLSKVQYA